MDASEKSFQYLSLSLDSIRQSLIRFEETIIFSFIERAQYKVNNVIYTEHLEISGQPHEQQGGGSSDGNQQRLPFMQHLLRETEKTHALVRRFTSPDEHAFFPDQLPAPLLPALTYPAVLHGRHSSININAALMQLYIERIVPLLAPAGDDANYGSSSLCDINCLAALSKRIHYGKFVAESKFRAQPGEYGALIAAGDRAGLMRLLTDQAVEQRVLRRVRLKAATLGQDLSGVPAADAAVEPVSYKVSPDLVTAIYRDMVIPLTKQVQVDYLMLRLEPAGPPPPPPLPSLPAAAPVAVPLSSAAADLPAAAAVAVGSAATASAASGGQTPVAAGGAAVGDEGTVAYLGPVGTFSFEAASQFQRRRFNEPTRCCLVGNNAAQVLLVTTLPRSLGLVAGSIGWLCWFMVYIVSSPPRIWFTHAWCVAWGSVPELGGGGGCGGVGSGWLCAAAGRELLRRHRRPRRRRPAAPDAGPGGSRRAPRGSGVGLGRAAAAGAASPGRRPQRSAARARSCPGRRPQRHPPRLQPCAGARAVPPLAGSSRAARTAGASGEHGVGR
eukprot:TRINITY_DN2641_c0_g1_i3.p1 TRINITY_DN2641_c0_g1~~TRINITY_DN2641_c0_g1_i3.p1  ORF type:complete len:556 (+),score=115.49 TRINITY_DN2641_c0_g1_i3:345-2012(+)